MEILSRVRMQLAELRIVKYCEGSVFLLLHDTFVFVLGFLGLPLWTVKNKRCNGDNVCEPHD